MSNVKPGDLAKIVHDPNFGTCNNNRQVLVLGPCLKPYLASFDGSPLWDCEALEPIHAKEGYRVVQAPAGSLLAIADSLLRRIDPPADTNEVFRDQPTELDRLIGLEVYFKERA